MNLKQSLMVIALLAVCGCAEPSPDSSALVITPGVGISNIVALGMPFADVRGRLKAKYYSNPPWRPWRKPYTRQGVASSLGIYFDAPYRDGGAVQYISFYVCPSTNRHEERFQGSLSCGMSFSSTLPLGRDVVLREFGELEETVIVGPGSKPCGVTIGINHAVVCSNLNWERIYYPSNGISFDLDLKEAKVKSVNVFPRRAEPP